MYILQHCDYICFFSVPACPVKGQFRTADCSLVNATCNDPYPVKTKCDYPQCVCPKGQVINEDTNACVYGAECRKHI